MFLKYLKIRENSKIIRNIKFRKGINLIVDKSKGEITGNNVGKTTVLKLIDFCFGADKKIIWEDPENRKEVYTLVKNYLINNKVLVELCLTENLEKSDSKEVLIERNFISKGKKVVRNINGEFYKDEDFDTALKKIILSKSLSDKPSFRQIVSHNIRYKDWSVNHTLKTLGPYTSDAEYETLYLFLLGCKFAEGNEKQLIIESIKQEVKFKKRLEKVQTKSAYESTLSLIENDIDILKKKKENLNINEEFENDLEKLNEIKYKINRKSSEISKLSIRIELINETEKELRENQSDIDLQQLKQIYEQATDILGELQKTFENLVKYHNKMLSEKVKYITKELPELESKLLKNNIELKALLDEEVTLTLIISKSDSFEELEEIINELNNQHRLKGEYENIVKQLEDVEKNLKTYDEKLQEIDKNIFSDKFEEKLKLQIKNLNKCFSSVSESLYKEKYALKYDKEISRNGQKNYKFSAFNTNFSSGKKQGEISCFDIAYTMFADKEKIPSLHFILNDKKELMHNNQLVEIAKYVNEENIQFIASILKDKLPDKLNDDDYFILELSGNDKLFKI